MIILLCGLSGAGKTTIGLNLDRKLRKQGTRVELIDGDEYRQTLCRDLGFSKEDRMENIRRLGFIAGKFSSHGIISVICAINPYKEMREELKATYKNVKTIYVDCPLQTLKARDTKGLYRRAFLPAGHPQKLVNLSGINDDFDIPQNPDLYLNTAIQTVEECTAVVFSFLMRYIPIAEESYSIRYLPRIA